MCEVSRTLLVWLLATLAGAASADGNVSVQWKQLTFEETHELVVTPAEEFILSFAPNPAQGVFPIRVWIKADGGDTSRPLLVTARRRIGAWTWQLPYRSGAAVLFELERTLCPDDSVDVEKLNDDCDAEDTAQPAGGEFSLHVSSSCAAPTRVRLRASFARDWRLPFLSSTPVDTQQGAPRVNYYRWLPGQRNVRLVVDSDDDVCATIAVQNYTCPIAETLEEIEVSTLRMTVARSGGVQLSRSRYPRGFYVLSVVQDSDAACRAPAPAEDDWLWEAAVLAQPPPSAPPPPPRRKALTLHTRAALTRAQYVAGAGATLAVFALFYVLFGALVLAQRWPRWKRLVAPRAVLARKPEEVTRSEVESTMSMSPGRRRRDSTATFDSSDNSDTDEEEDAGTATTVVNSTVHSPPPSAPRRVSTPATPVPPDTPVTPDTSNSGSASTPAAMQTPAGTDTAHPPDGDTHTAHPPDGDTHTAHPPDGDTHTAHPPDGDTHTAHPPDGDTHTAHPPDGDTHTAHPPDGDTHTAHPPDGDTHTAHPPDGDTHTAHPPDGDTHTAHPPDGDTHTAHPPDGDTHTAHPPDGDTHTAHPPDGDTHTAHPPDGDTHTAHPPDGDTHTAHPPDGDTHTRAVQTEHNGHGRYPVERVQSLARPFGLPARLRVAALARRRARVLGARSDRYLYTLYTVALFYALPVLQFVAGYQLVLNATGSLDACYYNFLCAHPAGAVSDFNHVFSNAGYLLLGALFMLQVRRRRLRRKRKPRDEEYGIPAHYGLLSSLGAAMMMVALLSATYHVCPNALNFQFDTAFMYVLAVLSMVKIYQARHPDINARAHATFGVLAVLIALVVWGVLGGGPLFWSVFTVLHVFTFLLLSLRIYYVGQFRLEKQSLAQAARSLAAPRGLRPLYSARLVMLLIANAVNWGFALYGLFTQSADFAGHLLAVLLCNTLLYMVFYLSMKLLHGERPRWYAWLYLCAAAAAWAPGLYFFVSGSTDWATTPALSRQLNHECRVLQFYDSHDLWHMLSAVALFFSFNAMLTWDDGLSAVKRTEIAVF